MDPERHIRGLKVGAPSAYPAALPVEESSERPVAPGGSGANARLNAHSKAQDYVVVIPFPPGLEGLVPRVELDLPTIIQQLVFELLGVVDTLGYPHPPVLEGDYELGYEITFGDVVVAVRARRRGSCCKLYGLRVQAPPPELIYHWPPRARRVYRQGWLYLRLVLDGE